jgi:hypothetical protein
VYYTWGVGLEVYIYVDDAIVTTRDHQHSGTGQEFEDSIAGARNA